MPLVKIADNWNSLSDSQKENLFNSVGYGLANVEELKKLGKFKIATYSMKNEQFVGKVIGTPKVQIVLPKELFNIKQVDNINKVSIVRKEESKPNIIKNALLHFDNDFNDIYTNKWSAPTGVTFTNDCKFGDGAVKFNNGMLQIQNRLDFKLEDFTIDFWTKCNPTQTAQYPTLISDESYGVRLEVAQLFTYSSYVPFDTIADDTWHHIALVRDNGVYSVYKDGQLIKSDNTSTNNLFSLKSIGCCYTSQTNSCIDGIIDELMVRPYVVWRDNFTPPTQPYDFMGFTKTNSEIRFAFTIDKNKYFTYSANDWKEIQTDEIPQKGCLANAVELIPTAKWRELITNKETQAVSKFGVAYSINQQFVNDDVYIDSLDLNINQQGKWRKCSPYSQYVTDYVDNETVEIQLVSSGSYKINYSLG